MGENENDRDTDGADMQVKPMSEEEETLRGARSKSSRLFLDYSRYRPRRWTNTMLLEDVRGVRV